MLRRHRIVFLKDSQGSGGTNITRVSIFNGQLFAETTNPYIARILVPSLAAKKAGETIIAGPADDWWGFYNENRHESNTYVGTRLTRLKKGDAELHLNLAMLTFLSARFAKHEVTKALVQAEVPNVRTDGMPFEVRLYVQKGGENYRVTHHYAKKGSVPIATNCPQGGQMLETISTLSQAFRHNIPRLSIEESRRMAREFVRQSSAVAEELFNINPVYRRELSVQKAGGELGEAPVYKVTAQPILGNVDVIPAVNAEGELYPAIIEHHEGGNLDIGGARRKGLISDAKYREMMAIHRRNISDIVSQARKKISSLAKA